MKQIFKYLIVGILAFALGCLVGILVYKHFYLKSSSGPSSAATKEISDLKKDMPKEAKGKKDAKSKDEKKSDKKDSKKESGKDKKSDTEKKKEGSEKPEKSDKKEADEKKKKPKSVEYLRSLWPIKKRKAVDISGGEEKELYLDGTAPYGPPSSYRKDLLEETNTLTVPGEPTLSPPPPPLTHFKTPSPAVSDQEKPAPPSFYQVQVGKFSSLDKAKKARDLLRYKGYKVDIYYTGHATDPSWFYVRFSTLFSKPQAYQKAQTVAVQEKIVPTIIALTTEAKKLE
jgi:hypothetical protein